MKNAIKTEHNLDFEVAPYDIGDFISEIAKTLNIKNDDKYPHIKWILFRVGTCNGQWRETPDAFEILSIINECPGNGHFNDVLQWFEFACKQRNLPLRILEFTNNKFKKHCIKKLGFVEIQNGVEKYM